MCPQYKARRGLMFLGGCMQMCGGSRHNRYLPKTRFSPVGAAQEFGRHKQLLLLGS